MVTHSKDWASVHLLISKFMQLHKIHRSISITNLPHLLLELFAKGFSFL